MLGAELGGFFAELHRGHGVDLRTDARVDRIEPGMKVVLADGEEIGCSAVLLGVGVAPATALAETGGLTIDDGIVCDEHLRASAPGVFAAGDVASVQHPRYGRRIRVEHWATAGDHGSFAGRAMLDGTEPFTELPYFFTDQYDLGMEYVGRHSPDDRLVIRGSTDEGVFQAFWIGSDGSLSAGMHVNDWDAIEPIRALVGGGARVDARALADTGVPVEAAVA